MENTILPQTRYFAYPGRPVPLVTETDVLSALNKLHEGAILRPPVNVAELPDSYKVEVAIPGVRREDFLIHANDNVLSVCVLHQEPGQPGERFQLHEFNYECVKRPIDLPRNADVEFSVAEYKSGILSIYVPKSNEPSQNLNSTIVVY